MSPQKEVTPRLLARIFELSGGASLTANIALVRNNAKLGAEIARALVSQPRAPPYRRLTQGGNGSCRQINRNAGVLGSIRSNFLAGLAVIAPGVLTVWLVWNVVTWIDGIVMPLIPRRFHPDVLTGWDVPGLGVVIFLVFTVVMGYFTKGFIGRTLVIWSERIVEAMPVVRSIYNAVKQIADTVLARTAPTFDRACLIGIPPQGDVGPPRSSPPPRAAKSVTGCRMARS